MSLQERRQSRRSLCRRFNKQRRNRTNVNIDVFKVFFFFFCRFKKFSSACRTELLLGLLFKKADDNEKSDEAENESTKNPNELVRRVFSFL